MTPERYAVFDEYYRGLRANGWTKDDAAKAARRHVDRMKPRELKFAAKAANAAFERRFAQREAKDKADV